MNTFSPTRAAAAGFRLVRDRPGAVALWSLAYLLFFVLMMGAMAVFMWPLFSTLANAGTVRPPEEVFSRFAAAFIPIVAIVLPLSLLFAAVSATAIFRSILRPEERAFGYLRLGMDELRQLGVLLLLSLGAALTVGVLGGALFAGIALMRDAGGIALGLIGVPALLCLYVFLLVRFSLAPAATFAEGRISIMESWRLTKGRFWPMLGMFALTWVFSLGVGLVGAVIVQIFMALGPMQYLTSLVPQAGTAPDFSHLPPAGAGVIIGVIGYALTNVLMGVARLVLYYAAPATAYAQLTGDSPETTGEVFS